MRRLKSISYTFLLLIISLILVSPFYITFILSTYSNDDIFRGLHIFVSDNLANNIQSLLHSGFANYYINSLFIAVCVSLLTILISSLSGFAFARLSFRGKSVFEKVVILQLMIPSQIGIIAFVILMRVLGWTNTFLPFIIPSSVSCIGVFWMIQYIKTNIEVPILESAYIEGASHFAVFYKLVLPLIKPGLFFLGSISFIWSWNSYLLPSIIINKRSMYTVPLGIATLGNMYKTDYSTRFVGLLFSMLPLIILFICGSKYLLAGVADVNKG